MAEVRQENARQPFSPAAWTWLLAQIGAWRTKATGRADRLTNEAVQEIAGLYQELPNLRGRSELLTLLALTAPSPQLAGLADLLVECPPTDHSAASVVVGSLLGRDDLRVEHVFPRLLDAIQHPALAAPVLDLASYLTHQRRCERHPAHAKLEQLIQLLRAICRQLRRLEEDPASGGTVAEIRDKIDNGTSLAVSLAHTMAQIGDPVAAEVLIEILQLRHRRIRTEAAAALARLGNPKGRETLAELAAEPVARLRVLSYVDELGLQDIVQPQFRTAEARAEAELAVLLAQPHQLGIAPNKLDLFEQRSIHWPGYDDLVDCYLIRFEYHLPGGVYSNVGIAGPVVHAFSADLQDLSADDIYAAYAGWSAQHEEIYHQIWEPQGQSHLAADSARALRKIHDRAYTDAEPALWCSFFGDRVFVARASSHGDPGIAVVDELDVHWLRAGNPLRPLGPEQALYIYLGRKLLRSFNT